MAKKTTSKKFNNFDMNAETYAMRKKVINIIRELKKNYPDLPRIDVRIGEPKRNGVLGVARLNDCVIWISKKAVEQSPTYLRHVVMHELVHAVTGFDHDEKCPLMAPVVRRTTRTQQDDAFKTYMKMFDKKTKEIVF